MAPSRVNWLFVWCALFFSSANPTALNKYYSGGSVYELRREPESGEALKQTRKNFVSMHLKNLNTHLESNSELNSLEKMNCETHALIALVNEGYDTAVRLNDENAVHAHLTQVMHLQDVVGIVLSYLKKDGVVGMGFIDLRALSVPLPRALSKPVASLNRYGARELQLLRAGFPSLVQESSVHSFLFKSKANGARFVDEVLRPGVGEGIAEHQAVLLRYYKMLHWLQKKPNGDQLLPIGSKTIIS